MSKNMQGFGMMIQKLKASPKRIVFTEGTDERILEAASRLLASNFLTPILVGKEDEVQAAAEEYGYNIRGAQIIDPENFDRMDEMIAMFCELRKSKNIQPDEARKILSAGNSSVQCLLRWVLQMHFLVALHTQQQIQFVRHCSLSRQSLATQSYLHALSLFVHLLQVRTKY